jgi:uncharacterized membrane protein YraQ (UPF0718 family)
MFRKGANFTAAMAFQFASTNLVLELGILLAVLMGWQFTLAEFTGGPLMIIFMVLLFKAFLTPRIVEAARLQAEKGLQGRMEGHAGMDMSVHEGSVWQRMISSKGRTAVSHFFVMDWASLWLDVAGGLLIAGALAAWVPNDFWQAFFLQGHPILAKLWGPLVGPVVAILSFVCSVGNVPLAAVFWNSGISFGGVVAFLFADLIVLPIPEYLSEILWAEDQRISARNLLYLDGGGLTCGGVSLWVIASDSAAAKGADHRRGDSLGLHHDSQHRFYRFCDASRHSFSTHWGSRHAAHDE